MARHPGHKSESDRSRQTLSVSLSGIPGVSAATLRRMVERAAGFGVRGVVLNAATPGLRPRELSRSARRDIAAALRRAELVCDGVDLFVPPDHLQDPTHADRAVSALTDAVEMAAELAELTGGTPVLTTLLPSEEVGEHEPVADVLGEMAGRVGARVADLAWPPGPARDAGPLGIGLDPATVMLSEGLSANVPREAARLGGRLAAARLSDLDASGRATVGDGRLDAPAYLVSLAVGGYGGPVVADVRGLSDPWAALTAAMDTCQSSHFGSPQDP